MHSKLSLGTSDSNLSEYLENLSENQHEHSTIPSISHFQAIDMISLPDFDIIPCMDPPPIIILGFAREQKDSPYSARTSFDLFIYLLFIYLDPTNISIGP